MAIDYKSKYRELAVSIKCIDSGGSGSLFQPFTNEYTYVITAKHCLEGTDDTPQFFEITDIKIFSEIRGIELTVLDCYLHDDEDIDLAVIKVQYIEDVPKTLTTTPKDNSSLGLYGFPNILESDEATAKLGNYLECKSSFNYPDKYIIEFRPEVPISNITNNTRKTMGGYSGSGIYLELNNSLYLVGIFTELKEKDGAFQGLWGFNVTAINQILYKESLALLIPEEILNFEKYINTAFDSNEVYIKAVLKKNAKALLDLKPNDIAAFQKERLYLPYNSFIEGELLNPKLWEGWVSLLTYHYMETAQLPDKENFNLMRNANDYTHNIKLYFTSHKTISPCIMDLHVGCYEDLEKNDLIVINTKEGSPGSKSFNKDRTKRILSDIYRVQLIERGIDIDDPDHQKDVQFIHIDLFTDSFAKHDDIQTLSELEENIKNSIKEVFNNVR